LTDPTLYVAAGALVGVLVGLTGVGGGSLMTPILVLAFGQSPAVAVGTDLLFAALTKITASFSFGASRRIDWRIVRRLALGSLPGAAGVLATLSLSTRSALHADRFLLLCLGVMLVLTAAGMLLERIVRLRLAKSAQPRPLANPTTTPPLALTVLPLRHSMCRHRRVPPITQFSENALRMSVTAVALGLVRGKG